MVKYDLSDLGATEVSSDISDLGATTETDISDLGAKHLDSQDRPGPIGRLFKQLWNQGVANFLTSVQTKSGMFGETSDLINATQIIQEQKVSGTYKSIPYEGIPIDEIPIEKRDAILKARIGQMNELMQTAKVRTLHQADKLTPKFAVPSPETASTLWQKVKETGIDVTAGVGAFIGQLMLSRKLFAGAPEIFHWEIVNEASGGKPGHGAGMYALFGGAGTFGKELEKSIPGEGILSKVSRFAARSAPQSAAMGGITAVEGGTPTEIVTQALIAPALELLGGRKEVPEVKPVGPETIANAAYRLKDGTVLEGLTHPTILMEEIQKSKTSQAVWEMTEGGAEEGFTTSTGRFVGREEAATIAEKAKQVEGRREDFRYGLEGQKELDALSLKGVAEKVTDVPLTEVIKRAKEVEPTIESMGAKLENPELAKNAPVFDTYAGPVIAIPIGGKRKAGYFDAEFKEETSAQEIYNKLEGKKGFPNLRIEKDEGYFRVAWGESTKDFEGQWRKLGQMFGYKESAIKEFILKEIPEEEPDIQMIQEKISGQLDSVQDLRKTVAEPALKELRAKQAGQYKDLLFWNLEAGAKPEEAQTIALSGMKEAANVPEITPPELSGKEWELLFQKNLDVHTDAFDIVNTREAIVDWRNGKILQDSQFQYLQDVLGKKTAAEMYYKQQDLKPFNAWDYVKMGVQFFKLPFAYDVQFFRQASSFAARHPIKYVKGGYAALRSYVSEGFAERISNLTKANPNHNDAREHGVNFLSEAPFATVAGKELAPEQFAYGRPVLQKLLTVGLKKTPLKKLVLTPVRGMARWYLASERSMIVSCNQFMQGLWDTQIAHWQKEGISGDKLYKYKVNYANTINTFMKILRAKTATGIAIQQAANFVLFSPSMTASRVKRPYTLIANVGSRKYAAGLVATEIGKLFLISALTATMGQYLAKKFEWARKKDGSPLITSSYDPTSTKWGTTVIGDAHYDLGGGDTQFYRSLARLITGHYRNQAGVTKEAPRLRTLEQYAKSRETALLGVGVEVFTGRNFQGEKIWETPDWEEYAKMHKGLAGEPVAKVGELLTKTKVDKALFLGARELLKAVLPQFTSDMFDAALDAGWGTVMSTGVADVLSANAQIYPEAASISMQKAQEKAAQIEYGKNWDELGPNQQKKLTQQYKEIADWEQQAKFERSERDVEITVKPKYLDLPNDVSRILKQSKVPNPAVSRNIGSRFYLNDERFKKYQELAAGHIADRVTLLSDKEGWATATQEQKLTRLTEEIEAAKELARREILKEANLSASK